MINIETMKSKTEAGRSLTDEDIKVIAISREGASHEIEVLLSIIDRLTGTKWTLRG